MRINKRKSDNKGLHPPIYYKVLVFSHSLKSLAVDRNNVARQVLGANAPISPPFCSRISSPLRRATIGYTPPRGRRGRTNARVPREEANGASANALVQGGHCLASHGHRERAAIEVRSRLNPAQKPIALHPD